MTPAPYWRAMASPAFGETRDWIAVLPIAAIEQHGPHLPVGVDALIAEALVARVVAGLPEVLPATFLPVQQVCKSDEHLDYPGTLTLGWETAIKVWLEIGASVARAGVKKLVIVTSHGGNVAPMGVVVRQLRIEHGLHAVATAWGTGADITDLLPEGEAAYGIHAGASETAQMLAIAPDLVDMAQATDFRTTQLDHLERFTQLRLHGTTATGWMAQDLHPAGAAGDARAATVAMGEAILARHAAAFLALLSEVAALTPDALAPGPLGHA
ncbi:MAG: creatininase family protein [Pseudomonadota bacterium]